jgi:hypothetical protein
VSADSRCANGDDLRRALTGAIPEEQRASEESAEMIAQVRVAGTGSHAAATVTVMDRTLDAPAGARELRLSTDDCGEIAEALSLIVGVLIEAGRGIAPAPDEEVLPSESPQPAPVEQRPIPTPRAEVTPPKPKRYRWLGPRTGHDLAVGAGPAYGLVPGLAWTGMVGWGIRVHGAWPVWLSAVMQRPEESNDGRAEFGVAYGALHACPLTYARSRVRVRACPGLGLGVFRAEGRGFLAEKRSRELLSLAGLELSADLRLWGPWTIGLVSRVDVPLVRTRFVYYRKDGETPELHEASSLTIQAFLTTGIRFH